MARRKKSNNKFKLFVVGLVLIAVTWFAACYYYGKQTAPKNEKPVAQAPGNPDTAAQKPAAKPAAGAENKTASEPVFELKDYKDTRYGIEFQYPVPIIADPQCAKLIQTGDGLSLGILSLIVANEPNTPLQDFIDNQLAGMEIQANDPVTLGGQPGFKIDYQTKGMGFNGSDAFVKYRGNIYDFGLLASEAPNKCAGSESYEDKVYQSILSTLKFTN